MRRLGRLFDGLLPVGPRSVLFGAHQFAIHPLFVFAAWWKLYGFPWDPRLWLAFVLHDLGYLFSWCRDIDGPSGEEHPLWAAGVMSWLFDRPRTLTFRKEKTILNTEGKPAGVRRIEWSHRNRTWWGFCAYHSRFLARRDGARYSRLCVADKLATALEPAWLYLPRVILSGEIREYMARAGGQPGSKYEGMPRTTDPAELIGLSPRRAWHRRMVNHMRAWAYAHRDGAEDTWTPAWGCEPLRPGDLDRPYGVRRTA